MEEKEIRYIDLRERLPEGGLLDLRNMKEDDIHPNEERHRLIANIIYEYLLNGFE